MKAVWMISAGSDGRRSGGDHKTHFSNLRRTGNAKKYA
jgi:hypothetical protein